MEKFLPLFPLPVVVFPGSPLPLHIFEPRYKEMINECLENRSEFGIILAQGQKLHRIGTTVKIENVLQRFNDGRLNILTIGKKRFEVLGFNDDRAFLQGRVRPFDDTDLDSDKLRPLAEESDKIIKAYMQLTEKHVYHDLGETDPQALSFFLAELVPFELNWRQKILEFTSCEERLLHVNSSVGRFVNNMKVAHKLKHFFQVDAGFMYLVN